jgi:hypothetical protein
MRSYYRVCHKDTLQGLWYTFSGDFTGLIHDKFSFCLNTKLEMDFDEELVGWLSAVESIEDLYAWFTESDIRELQKHGWFIHEFECEDVKFYDKFQHLVIKQETAKVKRLIELDPASSTEQMKIDESKLSFEGSLNYILQIMPDDEDPDTIYVDQYQPRRNRVWNGGMTKEELIPQVEETIERMKIAISHMQEYLDGKRDYVYYWENEKEPWKNKEEPITED